MRLRRKYSFPCVVVALSLLKCASCLLDPITGLAVAGVAYFGYSIWPAKKTDDGEAGIVSYCRYYECCNNHYIRYDVNGLKRDLEHNLFGQHIANKTVLPALYSHYKNLETSQKPLVMSFHGTPGTGKNYMADRIVKHLYRLGDESKYVHKFRGRIDFPLASEVDVYRISLKKKIVDAVGNCPRSIFVFDEVDKMPEGVFESITSLLDHHSHINGVDFRKAIFIFLSNSGGTEISDALEDLMQQGKYREQTTIYNFEKIAETGAYNVKGGLKNTGLISSSLIDHFVPFLPMEKRHIEKCIVAEFQRLGKTPTDQQVADIADNYITYYGKFATFGCKRLNKKVEVMAASPDEW